VCDRRQFSSLFGIVIELKQLQSHVRGFESPIFSQSRQDFFVRQNKYKSVVLSSDDGGDMNGDAMMIGEC